MEGVELLFPPPDPLLDPDPLPQPVIAPNTKRQKDSDGAQEDFMMGVL
jgi:hypothetical protein